MANGNVLTLLNYHVDAQVSVYTKDELRYIEYVSIYHFMIATQISINFSSEVYADEVNYIRVVPPKSYKQNDELLPALVYGAVVVERTRINAVDTTKQNFISNNSVFEYTDIFSMRLIHII